MQMNLQLHHVVSDITGSTGMQIIRAILQGTQDAATLAQFRDVRCKASVATITKALTSLRIVAACGTDMTRWPTVKHFTSWLTLAPGNKISGGKVLSSRTRRSSNRATTQFRLAAICVGKTNTALGPSSDGWRHASARQKQSPPRLARSPSCSTKCCGTDRPIRTQAPTITSYDSGAARSTISGAVPALSDSSSSNRSP